MKRTQLSFAGLGLLALPAVAAFAPGDVAYTKRASTALLAQPSATAETVATVAYGRKLSIAAAQGAWLSVKDGAKTGWVYRGNLSEAKIEEAKGADGLPFGASETSASVAARPLAASAGEYADRKGLGEAKEDVLWLEQATAQISATEVKTYLETQKKGEYQ